MQAADVGKLTDTPVHKFSSGGLAKMIDDDLGIDVTARVVNKRKRDIKGQPGDVELEISNKPLDIAGMFNEMAEKQRINDLYAQGATNWDSHDFADNCDPTHPAVLRFWVPDGTARINKVQLTYRVEPFRAYSRAIASAPAITSGPSSTNTTAGGGSQINTNTGNQIWDISGSYGIGEVMSLGGDPPHRHGLVNHWHIFSVPAHTHEMPHTHVIPPHTHDIEYGIFNGPTPTAVTVKVDGQTIPGLGTNVNEIDIIPYLSKDGEGRIQRGTWHTIEIAPNSLGRIVASVSTQIFVNSRGGGDF